MFENFEELFKPKSLEDIVFASEESRELVEDLVSGLRPFPIKEGKCGILLYGVPGTGKSALARLLPEEIERARGGEVPYETYVQISPANNGVNMLENLRKQSETYPFGKYHYFVLDEVDTLTKTAMLTLKSIMNSYRSVFVLTTNNFDKIEVGVKDRCYCIPFNAAPAESWLSYARRILSHAGITGVTDAQLSAVLKPCNGSARQIKEAIVSVALKVRRTKLAPQPTAVAVTVA